MHADSFKFTGDGFCDDAFNTPEYEFDGGDCCLSIINREFCIYCICYASYIASGKSFYLLLVVQ